MEYFIIFLFGFLWGMLVCHKMIKKKTVGTILVEKKSVDEGLYFLLELKDGAQHLLDKNNVVNVNVRHIT